MEPGSSMPLSPAFSKLLSENKLKICAFVNLHYQISREKFEPEPGLELGPPDL